MPEVIEHVHRVTLRGAVKEAFKSRDPELLVSGSAGTGKSRGLLTKLHLAALQYPRMRGLIVRKTAVSLTSTTLVTFAEKVAPEAIETRLVKWFGGSGEKSQGYQYRNGSKIVVGGMDKPVKIMSAEYDMIFADEATEFTVTDWEAMNTRLRNGKMPYSQLIGGCNPDSPAHFLHQRAEAGLLRMLISTHRDNPHLYTKDGQLTEAGAAYMGRLNNLTGVRRLRLLDGLWVSAEGIIYEEWDPALHLVDRLPDGADTWPRYWSVDFGYRNPFVWQCWAEDPDGRLWLTRELYRTERLVEDHAKEILSIVRPAGRWIEPQPSAIICDHDAEDRATLERHLGGMSTVAAIKTVSDGIQAVAARLRKQGDGKPRLYVLRDARVGRDEALADAGKPTCTEAEFASYVWAKGLDGKPVKEEPEKLNDHGMDAMRYVVMHRDWKTGDLFRGWID